MELFQTFIAAARENLLIAAGIFFAFSAIVFIHEYGHFWVARRCGVKVEAFSIGFGKELFGYNDKHGTRWKFCLVPLGGYVKFFGDASEASTPDFDAANAMNAEQKRYSFFHKKVWQRAAIVVAGPVANFLLTIAIFSVLFMTHGKSIVSPRLDEILAGGAAEQAGLQAGDVVKSINGETIKSFSDMTKIVIMSSDTPLTFVVARGSKTVEIKVTPQRRETKDAFGNLHKMGQIGVKRSIKKEEVETVNYGLISGVGEGVAYTYDLTLQNLKFLWRIVIGLESPKQLGGPVKIAHASAQAAQLGFYEWVSLLAFISLGLGITNLLPIPMLDGGHLVMYGIEAAKGSPLHPKAQEWLFKIGFALVISLFLFTLFNDVTSLLFKGV